MVKFNGNQEPASEESIRTLEKRYRITLPKEYRDFLLKYNGGIPVPDAFDFANKNSGSTIDTFYGFVEEDVNNLVSNIKDYRNRIPKSLFPIASDVFGNNICIGIKDDVYGKIYFWDHESEKSKPDFSNITFVSDSFDKFINSLYEFKL